MIAVLYQYTSCTSRLVNQIVPFNDAVNEHFSCKVLCVPSTVMKTRTFLLFDTRSLSPVCLFFVRVHLIKAFPPPPQAPIIPSDKLGDAVNRPPLLSHRATLGFALLSDGPTLNLHARLRFIHYQYLFFFFSALFCIYFTS